MSEKLTMMLDFRAQIPIDPPHPYSSQPIWSDTARGSTSGALLAWVLGLLLLSAFVSFSRPPITEADVQPTETVNEHTRTM